MVDLPDSPAPRKVSAGRLMLAEQGACTEKQHFDLAALGELIALELIFDFLIPLLPLLLLGAHTTPHDDGDGMVREPRTCLRAGVERVQEIWSMADLRAWKDNQHGKTSWRRFDEESKKCVGRSEDGPLCVH